MSNGRLQAGDRDAWLKQQTKTFTRWANHHLTPEDVQINELPADVQDGVVLCKLLRVLAPEKPFPKFRENPTMQIHRTENLGTALKFATDQGIKFVNIGARDLEAGNLKIVLGFLWGVVLRFQVEAALGDAAKMGGDISPKHLLLAWINMQVSTTETYDGGEVNNFTSAWQDGKVLASLIESLAPGAVNFKRLTGDDTVADIDYLMGVAETTLRIPRLVDAEDMAKNPDSNSVMTYAACFREAALELEKRKNRVDAKQSFAKGKGVTRGILGKALPITIVAQSQNGNAVALSHGDEYEVTVIAPDGTVVKTAPLVAGAEFGEYTTSYVAEQEGDYKVEVQLVTTWLGAKVKLPVHQAAVGSKDGIGDTKAPATVMKGADVPKSYVDGPGLQGGSTDSMLELTAYLRDENGKPMVGLAAYVDVTLTAEGQELIATATQLCANCSRNAATKHCGECNENLCDLCDKVLHWRTHPKDMKSHVRRPLDPKPKVKDMGDGSYQILFQPGKSGELVLSVLFDDEPLPPTPANVHIGDGRAMRARALSTARREAAQKELDAEKRKIMDRERVLQEQAAEQEATTRRIVEEAKAMAERARNEAAKAQRDAEAARELAKSEADAAQREAEEARRDRESAREEAEKARAAALADMEAAQREAEETRRLALEEAARAQKDAEAMHAQHMKDAELRQQEADRAQREAEEALLAAQNARKEATDMLAEEQAKTEAAMEAAQLAAQKARQDAEEARKEAEERKAASDAALAAAEAERERLRRSNEAAIAAAEQEKQQLRDQASVHKADMEDMQRKGAETADQLKQALKELEEQRARESELLDAQNNQNLVSGYGDTSEEYQNFVGKLMASAQEGVEGEDGRVTVEEDESRRAYIASRLGHRRASQPRTDEPEIIKDDNYYENLRRLQALDMVQRLAPSDTGDSDYSFVMGDSRKVVMEAGANISKGVVKIGVWYNSWEHVVEVKLYEARCLPPPANNAKGTRNVYAKLRLYPEEKAKYKKHKTDLKKKTLSPIWNETVLYQMDESTVNQKTLEVTLWGKTLLQEEPLGQILISLDKVPRDTHELERPVWYCLADMELGINKVSGSQFRNNLYDFPDGTIQLPSMAFQVTQPVNRVHKQTHLAGMAALPGVRMLKDGSALLPHGEVVLPSGNIVMPDGNIRLTNGAFVRALWPIPNAMVPPKGAILLDDLSYECEGRRVIQPSKSTIALKLGMIKLSVRYQRSTYKVVVRVFEARGMASPDTSMKLLVTPDPDYRSRASQLVQQTATVKKDINPEFNQSFSFLLAQSELAHKTLEVEVWDESKKAVIGIVLLPLSAAPIDVEESKVISWFAVQYKQDAHDQRRLIADAKAEKQKIDPLLLLTGGLRKPAMTPDKMSARCMNMSCATEFTSTNRRKNCQFCGKLYCKRCSEQTVVSAAMGLTAQRMCDLCMDTYMKSLAAVDGADDDEEAGITPMMRQFTARALKMQGENVLVKEGFLMKQGGSVKNWKRRYFMLWTDRAEYYKNQGDSKPAGTIDLSKGFKVYGDHANKREGSYFLGVESTKEARTYCMEADSRLALTEWVDAFESVNTFKRGGKLTAPKAPSRKKSETEVSPHASGDAGARRLSQPEVAGEFTKESNAGTAADSDDDYEPVQRNDVVEEGEDEEEDTAKAEEEVAAAAAAKEEAPKAEAAAKREQDPLSIDTRREPAETSSESPALSPRTAAALASPVSETPTSKKTRLQLKMAAMKALKAQKAAEAAAAAAGN